VIDLKPGPPHCSLALGRWRSRTFVLSHKGAEWLWLDNKPSARVPVALGGNMLSTSNDFKLGTYPPILQLGVGALAQLAAKLLLYMRKECALGRPLAHDVGGLFFATRH